MRISLEGAFKNTRSISALAGILLAFTVSACVQKKMSLETTAGSRTTALTASHVVAVLPFDGPGGDEAASHLEMMLHEASAAQLAPLTVVDRQHIERLRAELKLGPSGFDDPNKAKKLGKLLGADTIIVGRVSSLKKSEKHSTQQVFECTSWSEPKGFLGFRTCKQSQPKNVRCTATDANLTVQPRLIQVNSGEIRYTKLQLGAAQLQHCENTDTAPTDDTLRGGALVHAMTEIGRDLVPHRYVIEAALKLMPEGLAGTQREKFEGAVAFANSQRFDRACEIFGELHNTGATALPVRFNTAVCEEAFGSIDLAFIKMQEIDRSLNAPDADVNVALERMARRKADIRRLPVANTVGRTG